MTISTNTTTTTAAMAGDSRASPAVGAGTAITRVNIPSHTRRLWLSRIASGLRTALACFIVGCTTIYGPSKLRQQLTFPSFAYVTSVLIVGEATVGDSLRGAADAIYGTILAMLPAIISLTVIANWHHSEVTTTLAVALSSFMIMLPQSTPLITKRVALGQTVLVYVEAFRRGRGAMAIEHPSHVAACTVVGVVAALLAVLFPFPRLACNEVRRKGSYVREIEMARLRLYTTAFYAEEKSWTLAAISQAYSLSKEASLLIRSIKAKQQGSIQWEMPPVISICSQLKFDFPSDILQAIDLPLRGMEIALSSDPPIGVLTQELKEHLNVMEDSINLAMMEKENKIIKKQVKYEASFPSLWDKVPLASQNLPTIFFIFCLKLLLKQVMGTQSANNIAKKNLASVVTVEAPQNNPNQKACASKKPRFSAIPSINSGMVIIAIKSSLSMGLAVLSGILYSKDNGYWSGLTVAMAITPWREATFRMANLRAQGTALGTVYGVLGSLISQSIMELRFLVLLPWIFFTSFLRQSKMFGQAGGIAAAVSAIIMIGRKNYGSPPYFGIARLCETLIGLVCSILLEVILQPTRASTMARSKLSQAIQTLHECLDILITGVSADSPQAYLVKVNEKRKELTEQIQELKKLIREAEGEPNFWFLPFSVSCYVKIHSLLSRMTDLMNFLCCSLENIMFTQEGDGIKWEEIQESITIEIESLKMISTSIKCFKDVLQIKSLVKLEKDLKRKTISDDLEMGKKIVLNGEEVISSAEDESKMALTNFLQNAQNLIENGDEINGDVDLKNQLVLCLGTFAFCTKSLITETIGLEGGVLELVQGENPSKYINLHEISCKAKHVLPL